MSEIDSNLDAVGMAFMLCGDDDTAEPLQKIAYMAGGSERTGRAEVITGLENIIFVTKEVKLVGEWTEQNTRKGVVLGKCIGGKDFGIATQYGGYNVELKSISSFLERYHGDNRPTLSDDHGTVYVELYNESGEKPGWMIHYLQPDTDMEKELNSLPDPAPGQHTKKAMKDAHDPATPARKRFTTYVSPHYLIYLLFADKAGTIPFAAISFEWSSFKKKLSDLTGEAISEAFWMFLPNEAAQILNRPTREEMGVCSLTDEGEREFSWMDGRVTKATSTGYCWHIPLDELADIARVTMIGEKEAAISAALSCTRRDKDQMGQLIEARYSWLEAHAEGRHITELRLSESTRKV